MFSSLFAQFCKQTEVIARLKMGISFFILIVLIFIIPAGLIWNSEDKGIRLMLQKKLLYDVILKLLRLNFKIVPLIKSTLKLINGYRSLIFL